MRYLFFLLFLFVFSIPSNAQYISEDGEINRETMVADLKEFANSSQEQTEFIKEILNELVSALRNHPTLQESEEKRSEVILTIMDLGNKRSDFFFLSPRYEALRTREVRRANDTISLDVLILEGRLAAMQDSIRSIYQELKDIVEAEDQTRATREKAITLFATSNDLRDIEYIFENNMSLYFSDLDFDFIAFGPYFGEASTGLYALYRDKIPGYADRNRISLNHNWMLIPFMIKYWGDLEWSKNIPDFDRRLQFVLAHRMFLRDLNEPDLLIEFMRANAEDPDTPIFKMLERHY